MQPTAICSRAGEHQLLRWASHSESGLRDKGECGHHLFRNSPERGVRFGGGTAYATEAIASASGKHNINVGDPLPDTLSGLLSGSPFAYIVAIAPPGVSDGAPSVRQPSTAAITNAYVEDSWKVTPKLTHGLRCPLEYYTPITERAHRTGSFRTLKGALDYIVTLSRIFNHSEWMGPQGTNLLARLRTLARMQVER